MPFGGISAGPSIPSLSVITAGTLQVPLNLVGTMTATSTLRQLIGDATGVLLNTPAGTQSRMAIGGLNFIHAYDTALNGVNIYNPRTARDSFTLVTAAETQISDFGSTLLLTGLNYSTHPTRGVEAQNKVFTIIPTGTGAYLGAAEWWLDNIDGSGGSRRLMRLEAGATLALYKAGAVGAQFKATISSASITADRAFTFPDAAGELMVSGGSGSVSLSNLTAGTLGVSLQMGSASDSPAASVAYLRYNGTSAFWNVPTGKDARVTVNGTAALTVAATVGTFAGNVSMGASGTLYAASGICQMQPNISGTHDQYAIIFGGSATSGGGGNSTSTGAFMLATGNSYAVPGAVWACCGTASGSKFRVTKSDASTEVLKAANNGDWQIGASSTVNISGTVGTGITGGGPTGHYVWFGIAGVPLLACGRNAAGTQSDLSWAIGQNGGTYIDHASNVINAAIGGGSIAKFGANVSGTVAASNWAVGGSATNYISNTAGTGITGNVLAGNFYSFNVAGPTFASQLSLGYAHSAQNDKAWAIGQGATIDTSTESGIYSPGSTKEVVYRTPAGNFHSMQVVHGTSMLTVGFGLGSQGDTRWGIGRYGITTTGSDPAGIGSDSASIKYNATSGNNHNFLVAGTSEYTFDSSSFTIGDGNNIVLNTTTGSKIGTGPTQKIGFWNATPIVQPSNIIRTALLNMGLVANPSEGWAVVSKTANYTATLADDVIVCTSGTFTVTLPAATGSGKLLAIKNVGAGTITADGNAAETIDGAPTQTILTTASLMIIDYAAGLWAII